MYTKQLAFKRLLFLIVSLITLTTINAVNYTVTSAAAGNTGVGTSGTLQYCTERANANTDGIGPHVITFAVAGTFNYGLNFWQGNNNITIDGAAFPNAIVINQTAQASGNNNTLIFQNLTFSNIGGSAFNMGGAGTAFTFNNIRVLNCNGTGISIYSGASVTGSNLTIRSITNGSGISVSGPSLTLSNSTIARISGNGINANGAGNVNVSNTVIDTTGNSGINIAGGGNLTVSNNSIIRNVTGGHGIAKDGAGSSNISNTTITRINGSNFNGIYIGSGTPNVINNVNISAVSNGHGIEKRGTGTLTTSLTTIENISGNDKNGIYVDAGSAINITLSRIRNIRGGNGIQLNAASSGRISGVLFGLADDGITATGNVINKSAILINNGTINNFTIGGTGLANRNIISNSLENGIKILNVGTGFSVVNNFIGTDITGSLARPNGSTNLETDGGINIQTGTNIAINQNLISGNYGVGIFAAGGNNGLSIKGNIIGLDSTGFKPLSNVTLGIKISNATGVTIGGSAATDRNIISANGTNITHVSNSSGPTTYDWTNMAGIFWSNVRSSTIENNYIGTAISGNTTTFSTANDLGNWNGGIKIENSSSNNTIRNNVVGGNGFRSAVTQVNHYGTIGFLKGHGILIKDGSSSTNLVVGNRVGVGMDGSSKIGNKQDGISVQGASNTTIGGSTVADRNISSNNTYGIYVSSNYNGSKATNTFIYGNYLGTDATGTVAIGNGVRSDIINEGAGIGIRDSPNNLLLGGSLSGQGNLISGNNMGIELIGDVSSVSRTRTQVTQIKNNIIGLQADVVSVLPNLSYGIAFTAGASRNIIGGSGASDGNYISGNLADGIHMVNADSNTFQGNFIGVDINRAAKPNTGDGINLRTDSDNNIIGGVNTGEANTIGSNTGNGVQIMDATSTKNLIRKNVFLCNASRGVVLNGGNNAFATPLLTGTSTNLVITATTGNYPAGTIIDIYEVDETCASCPTNGTRLQGAVLDTSLTTTAGQATWTGGTAGKYYTALAHEGATNTFLNTSEFSGCYATNCTTPLITPTVTASPKLICENGSVAINIANTQSGISYQAFIGSTNVGLPIIGTGGALPIPIPSASLTIGNNIIGVKATTANACTTVTLSDTALIKVIAPPTITFTATGGTFCNSPSTASVQVSNSQTGVNYQVINSANTTSISALVPGTGGALTIPLNAGLPTGTYNVEVSATNGTCTTVTITDTARVIINKSPDLTLTPTAPSPICENTASTATITNAEVGVVYTVFEGATQIGIGNPTISLGTPAVGTHTYTFKASIGGCGIQDMTKSLVVVVNKRPDLTLTPSAPSPICENSTSTATITGAEPGVTYSAFEGSTQIGTGNPTIGLGTPTVGSHIYTFTANIAGCGVLDMSKTLSIEVNKSPDLTLLPTAPSPICENTASTATITNPEAGVVYTAFEGLSQIGTGNPTVNLGTPTVGTHTYTFKASIGGCGVLDMVNSLVVLVNKAPNGTLVPINNGPACTGSIVTVTIPNAETGVLYEVFNGTTSLGSDLGKNADLNINITAPGLAGDYTLTVKASISGCASLDLPNTILKVNQGPDVGLEVTANGPLCSVGPNSTPVITVKNAQSNVNYTVVKSDDTPVAGGDSPVLTGSDLVFTLSGLSVGTTNFKVTTEIAGCTKGELNTKPSIVINKLPNNALEINAISPICEGIDGSVTVVNAESGVSYQAVINTSPIGSAGNPNLIIPSSNLALAQINIIKVNANIAGCEAVLLDDTATIYVSPKPNVDLEVIQNGPICTLDSNTLGIVTIKNSGLGVNYTVFNGNTAASFEEKGTGTDLPIKLTLSTAGTYSLTVRTQVAGCGIDSLKNKVAFVINESPDVTLDLVAASNEICQKGQVELTIKDTKLGYTYSFIQNDTLLSPSSAGTGGDVSFTKILNKAGLYTYKVQVQIAGCSSDTLNKSVAVVVNPLANDAINLEASNNTICLGNAISIDLFPVQDKVKYELFDNGTLVDSIRSTNTLPITFEPLTPTTEGFHEYFVLATSKGCTAVRGLDTAGVQVNDLPDTLANVSYDPIICSNEDAVVSVAPAKSKTTYSLYNNTILLNAGLVNGAAGSISLNGGNLNVGKDTLSVFASIPGCKTVKITEEAIFKINKAPNLNLNPLGSSVCLGQNGEVTVVDTDTNATYFPYVTIYRRPNKLDSLINAGTEVLSNGGDVKFEIPNDKLTGDVSTIKVSVFVEGCGNQLLNDTTLVYQLNKVGGINGSSVVCEGSKEIYTVTPLLGAVDYKWSLSQVFDTNTTYIANKKDVNDSITVQYGTKDTLFVKVSPIGDLGACTNLEDSIQVIVYPPLDGSATILLRETVCLFDTDTLEFGDVVNVSGYEWSWTDSIQTIETIKSPLTYDKIVIKYMSTGFDTITLKLYSPCLVQPLVITKVIRILGPPTVDAGTYGIVPMLNKDIRSIDLEPGISTSENGPAPNDTLAYQWTELRGSVVDKSDDRDNASFKPRTLTNIVQLQVYHKALPYCAASDTAKVIIDLGIVIPNVFTPNNEGPLDTEAWNIQNLSSFYPNATLQIYNKWGALLREFRGGDYSIGWDGTRNGQDMPVATYYFILDLKNGIVHTGSVTLLR